MATQNLPLTSRARVVRTLGWLLRGLAWCVGSAIVAAVVAVGALWWWAGQDGSLARALALVSRWQPLQARDVQGALSDGGRIGELTWQQDGLTVQASDVTLSWKPMRLLFGEFVLGPVSLASLRIDDQRPPSTTPPAPPASLGLPLRVSLYQVSVARLLYSGSASFEATMIAGRYGFDGLYHDVTLASLQMAQGKYSGRAQLGAYGELPLDAQLHGEFSTPLPAAGTSLPLGFTAQVNGPITQLKARAELRANATGQAGQTGATGSTAAQHPEATLDADIAPFATQPLQQARALFRSLDLALLWPGAPQTLLSGEAHVRPEAGPAAGAPQAWTLSTTVDNAAPGPLDHQRLPLARLEASGEWRAGVALVRKLEARLAGGELSAAGEWTDADTAQWQVTGRARRVDPGQVYAALAAQPLNGEARAQGRGAAFGFELQLAAAPGAPARTATRTPARAAGPALDLRALRLRDAKAKGRWDRPQLQLDNLQVRTDDAQLDGALKLAVPVRGASGRVDFAAPGLKLSASGELREATGAGRLDLAAENAERAIAWLRQWPGMNERLPALQASGSATLATRWQGGWRDPQVDARLLAPSLEVRGVTAQALQLRGVEATLNGRLAAARLALRGNAAMGERQITLQAAAEGGQTGYNAARLPDWRTAPWHARVTELAASLQDPALGRGAWRVSLRNQATTNAPANTPLQLRWAPRSAGPWLETSAGEAVLLAPTATAATIAWQPVRWRPGELVTAGRIQGLPLAWIETVAGPQLSDLGLTGTLVFDGSWDATLSETLRLSATLARSGGDLTVRAEDGTGNATRVAAGVREAKLTLDNRGDQLNLALRWDSERAGTADARLATRLARDPDGNWSWPVDAPLEGRLAARLPRIGVWSVLAPPGWRLRGSLATDLAIAGTRAAPAFTGNLNADDLALRSVVDGIEFGNGRLRARLEGTRIRVDEFALEGAGEKGVGGTLSATGEAGWIDGRAQARLTADVKQLRASIRTDRQVTVSGQLTAQLDGRSAELKGALTVDRALIVLPDETKPTLGDDVIVISGGTASAGARAPAETAAAPDSTATDNRALALAVKLDLGRDFRVQGRGIDTRVRGALDITGATLAAPRIAGTVRTFGGQYRAYGQRLDVEQGVLIFSGTPDNPALDILALRPNMLSEQKVGVQITGTALLPRVRLYASPELSDAEKLSWLVLGRSSASGGAEAALLQQAALALLGSRSGGMSGGLAAALGLDELSVRGSSTNESGATTQGAITLGKRFSRNFYAAYERSLSGALGTLYVFYDLSRRFTVRAQTGERSAVDLIYTLSYD